jgi:hypothetical protein
VQAVWFWEEKKAESLDAIPNIVCWGQQFPITWDASRHVRHVQQRASSLVLTVPTRASPGIRKRSEYACLGFTNFDMRRCDTGVSFPFNLGTNCHPQFNGIGQRLSLIPEQKSTLKVSVRGSSPEFKRHT